MRIVVDANRVIAALIKDSTTRKLLFSREFEFFAPEYFKEELEKYKYEIAERTNASSEDLEKMFNTIAQRITSIAKNEYASYMEAAKREVEDVKDVAYLAVCIALNADGIWTHDPHFKRQQRCKIFTNIDLLRIIRNKSEKKL